MPENPDLSIIIVSFQVRELLAQCLASLESSSSPPLEIILVDNASSDGSVEMVRERFPDVCLIANAQNRGFAAANNQGLERARGRYLMLLNPDTEIPPGEPGALATLVDFMDAHSHAGACGPRLSYGDGSLQQSAFQFPGLLQIYLDLFPTNWRLKDSRLNGRYSRAAYDSNKPFVVDHPLGAAFLVRRETAEQVGWLDESYFIYVEEVDWAMRIKRAGWEIWCVPGARIVHHEARSTLQFRDRMFVELWRARRYYFKKYYSSLYNAAVSLIVRRGMARLARQARAQASAGLLPVESLANQLQAYAAVTQMYEAN